MSKPIIAQHTALETAENVTDVLKMKVAKLEAQNLPVESGIADYIYMADSTLDIQLEQLKTLKKEITQREKEIKAQKERIRIDGAKFFEEMGVDKLKGMLCSSVTYTPAKDQKEIVEKKEEFVLLEDEKEVQDLLISLGKAEMRTVEVTKTTAPQPAKIKINKRRVHGTEVV